MPDGGRLIIETGKVRIGESDAVHGDLTPGEYVRLSVSDTGHGIPKEIPDLLTWRDVSDGAGWT